MQLKNLGNLQNVLNAFTGVSSIDDAANIFQALNLEAQRYILTSGKLNDSQLEYIASNIAWVKTADDKKKALSGLVEEEFNDALATAQLKAANKGLSTSQVATTTTTTSLTAALQGLKTAVLTNPLLMATAVVAGLFAVYKVVDLLTVSFEEQKEIVNDLSNEVNELQSEYDKLKDDPSVNGNKLSALKRELEIKKDILEIEKETLALKDMQENMPDISNKTGTSGGHVNPTWTPEDTAETDIRGDLQKLYQARNNMSKIDNIIPVAQDMIMQGYVQQEADALKELSEHTNTLKKEYLEIEDAKAKLEQYVEDGTLKGVNADLVRKQIAEYQAEIDRLDPIILEAELELGTASYLEAYNQLWDKIENDDSHRRSREYSYADKIIPIDTLDDIVSKTKELNQAFLDGEKTAKEYLNSISNLISDSGLENALSNVGNWEGASTDYLEQVVSGLATQVSDSLMESTGRFMRDASSVQEYTNELESAAEAEMKLLKGLHKLKPVSEDGQVNLEGLTDETLEAAKAYNKLENSLDDLHEVDAMIEVNTNYADLIADYENWTEDMLDTEPIQNYVKAMSEAIAQYAQSNKDEIDTIVADLTEATGVAIEKEKLLSANAASYLQDVCGNSIVAVHGMVVYSTGETTKVVTNASQALGGVLEALGNMIENFEYTITATPKVVIDPKIETDDNGVPHLQLGSYELNFSGKGGQSVQDFSTALKGAASYFENNDVFGEKLNNVDSYKRKGGSAGSLNNGTGNQNPTGTGKTGDSGSSKDPHIAEVDKYKNLTDAVDEYDRKLQQLERTYDKTDSVEERIGLKKAEIKLYQEQKDAIDALNKARDKEISDLVNKLRGQGFKIDYDPATDNLLIHNREHINDLNQSIVEQYEEYIERVDELNDANKDSADQWDELTSSIVKAGKELKDLEKEKYEDYIEGAEHVLRLMENRKDAFGKESSVYTDMMNVTLKRWKDLATTDYQGNIDQIRELEEQWMDFYDARIEKEKEILEMQLDDNDRVLDGVIKVIDDQIKALDDQIDGLSKANDERKKALELQKAQAELDKARNQKTRHVLRKDVGWVWESNEDKIKEAEENLSDLEYESKVDALEKEKEALEDLKEKWEEIPDIVGDEQNRLLMIEKLGADAESDILNDRIDVYEDFKDDYIDIQEQIQDKTDELEEHTSAAYLNVVKAFENMAKLAGIGLDTGVTTQTTQSSWYVNKDGKAPSQAQVGDIVYTKGGTYQITGKDENGKFTSTKLDDVSTNITDGMWGTEYTRSSKYLTSAISTNTDVVRDIVDTAEDNIEQIKHQIITEAGLSDVLKTGNKVSQDEIVAILDNMDTIDGNSVSVDGNTVKIGNNTIAVEELTAAINNFEFEFDAETGTLSQDGWSEWDGSQKVAYWEDEIARLIDSGADQWTIDYAKQQLALVEKKYADEIAEAEKNGGYANSLNKNSSLPQESQDAIKKMQEVYNIAKEAGNTELMNQAHAIAESIRNGAVMSPIQIGTQYTTSVNKTSGKSASTGTSSSLQDNYEWLLNKGGWSEGFTERLEEAIAREKYGSGHTTTTETDEFGRSYSVTTATNPAEVGVGADAIKEAYEKGYVLTNENTKSLNENTDASNYSGDAGYYAGDAMYDASDSISGSVDKLDKTVENAGTTITNAIENASKSEENSNTINGSSVKYTGGSNGWDGKDSSTGAQYKLDKSSGVTKTVVTGTDKYGKPYSYTTSASAYYKKKAEEGYASGGTNIPAGIANVDEDGAELIVKPDKGRIIEFEYDGNTVFDANTTANIMRFANDPHDFISGYMNNNSNQVVYTAGGTTTNQYSFHDMHLHGIKDVDDFAKKLPNLHIIAEQYCTSNTHSTYY